MNNNILIVEDDFNLGEMLQHFLNDNGYVVTLFRNAKDGVKFYNNNVPNLVIMDVMLPDMIGIDAALEMQKSNNMVPIIFMTGTAFDQKYYESAYVQIKARNYIEKPIIPQALLAQIKGILNPRSSFICQLGDNTIKIESQNLIINHDEVTLREKDIKVLIILLENRNNIVKRKDIIKAIWKDDRASLNNTLDSCIKRIRDSISKYQFIKIETIYGEGYMISTH